MPRISRKGSGPGLLAFNGECAAMKGISGIARDVSISENFEAWLTAGAGAGQWRKRAAVSLLLQLYMRRGLNKRIIFPVLGADTGALTGAIIIQLRRVAFSQTCQVCEKVRLKIGCIVQDHAKVLNRYRDIGNVVCIPETEPEIF